MATELSGQAVMWTLFGLAYIMVGLRIGVRMTRRQQKHVGTSDIFLAVSAVDCLGLMICDTWTYTLGGMSSIADSKKVTASGLANAVVLDKLSFVSNYFYDTGMYFPKATLLALYFNLIPITMPRLRTMLYVVSGYTLVCTLTTCLLDTFYCHNIPDNWSLKEGACSSFNSTLVFQVDWALNFSSDVLIFTLPFPLLRHLQLERKQLYGLWFTFALGIATIGVNLGRFISIQVGNGWNGVYVWSMAEMAVAIIVVSLPALKALLARHRNFGRTLSRSHSKVGYASGSHHKLPSDENVRKMGGLADETGSEVELHRVHKTDVIYKTEEITVDSQPIESEEGDNLALAWTNNEFRFQAGKDDF